MILVSHDSAHKDVATVTGGNGARSKRAAGIITRRHHGAVAHYGRVVGLRDPELRLVRGGIGPDFPAIARAAAALHPGGRGMPAITAALVAETGRIQRHVRVGEGFRRGIRRIGHGHDGRVAQPTFRVERLGAVDAVHPVMVRGVGLDDVLTEAARRALINHCARAQRVANGVIRMRPRVRHHRPIGGMNNQDFVVVRIGGDHRPHHFAPVQAQVHVRSFRNRHPEADCRQAPIAQAGAGAVGGTHPVEVRPTRHRGGVIEVGGIGRRGAHADGRAGVVRQVAPDAVARLAFHISPRHSHQIRIVPFGSYEISDCRQAAVAGGRRTGRARAVLVGGHHPIVVQLAWRRGVVVPIGDVHAIGAHGSRVAQHIVRAAVQHKTRFRGDVAPFQLHMVGAGPWRGRQVRHLARRPDGRDDRLCFGVGADAVARAFCAHAVVIGLVLFQPGHVGEGASHLEVFVTRDEARADAGPHHPDVVNGPHFGRRVVRNHNLEGDG